MSLVERARAIAPRQQEGRSNDFAFKMDGLSLLDLNKLVNDMADRITALEAENAALRDMVRVVIFLQRGDRASKQGDTR